MNQLTEAQAVNLTRSIALGLGLPAQRFPSFYVGDSQRRKSQWREI